MKSIAINKVSHNIHNIHLMGDFIQCLPGEWRTGDGLEGNAGGETSSGVRDMESPFWSGARHHLNLPSVPTYISIQVLLLVIAQPY